MRWSIGCVLLLGCLPEAQRDCDTPGGLQVTGVSCAAAQVAQDRFEAMVGQPGALKGRKLYVGRTGVDTGGGWHFSTQAGRVTGTTLCWAGLMTVGMHAEQQDFAATAFFHEAYHLFLQCEADPAAPDPMHPWWDVGGLNSINHKVLLMMQDPILVQ